MNKRFLSFITLFFILFFGSCYVSCKEDTSVPEQAGYSPAGKHSGRHYRKRKKHRKHKKHHKYRKHRKKYSSDRRNYKPVIIPPGKKLKAKVVHVVDADTAYMVLKNGQRIKARLAGINAPECHKERVKTLDGRISSSCKTDDEAFGYKAFVYLNKIIYGKEVEIDCVKDNKTHVCKSGHFHRPLITVYYKGKNINKELVKQGMAFTFTKYPSEKRAEYCKAEFDAIRHKRGMWALGRTVKDVLSLMSRKTRKWYAKHDFLCKRAMSE